MGKLEHFIDVDFDFLTATIGLKKIQAKRLVRILQELHGIKIEINIIQIQTQQQRKMKKNYLDRLCSFTRKANTSPTQRD